MSMQDLQSLMKMVEDDSAIAEKVEAIGHDNIDGLIAYAKELGLTLDASDFAAMKESLVQQSSDVDDGDLESASGGWLFRRRPRTPEERKYF